MDAAALAEPERGHRKTISVRAQIYWELGPTGQGLAIINSVQNQKCRERGERNLSTLK